MRRGINWSLTKQNVWLRSFTKAKMLTQVPGNLERLQLWYVFK